MKKLIIIRGPLGVGKTTIATSLAQKFDATYVSVDQIIDDHMLVPSDADGVPLESFLQANQIIRDRVENVAGPVIVDGCFYYREQIDDLVKTFVGDVGIITLLTSVETCIKRDSERDHVYGEDAARFVHMVTTEIHEGHEIDTTHLTIEETVERVLHLLQMTMSHQK